MFTSFFDNFRDCPNGKYKGYELICISGAKPDWFEGRREGKLLAPKRWFYDIYKQDNDKDFYTKKYHELILKDKDPLALFNILGNKSILLCWEKPGEFCHRRLVAEYLQKALKIQIIELEMRVPNIIK